MDYGWLAIYLQDTKCSWVSNLEFNGISVGMKLDYTKNNLVNNAKFICSEIMWIRQSLRTAVRPQSRLTKGTAIPTEECSIRLEWPTTIPRLFFCAPSRLMLATLMLPGERYESWSHFVHNPSVHGVCTTDRGLGFNPLDFGSVRYSGCAAEALDYGVDYQGTHPESLYEAQSALRDLHSIFQDLARDGLYGSWSEWGACDLNVGMQSSTFLRSYHLITPPHPISSHLNSTLQSAFDSPPRPPRRPQPARPPEQVVGTWSSWSAWTTCNGECGTGRVGTQERVRTCEANKECVLSQGSGSQGVTIYTRRQTDSKACTTQPCEVCACGAWVPTGGCTDGVLEYTRDECWVGQPQVLTVLHLDGSDSGTCVAPKGQTQSEGKCSPFTVKMNVELSGSWVRFGHRNWCVDLGDDASFLGTPVKIYNCAETDPDSSLGLKIASVQFATDPETGVTPDTPYSLWGYRMSSTEPLCMGVVADSRGDQHVATVLCFAPEASVADLEVPEGHAVVSRTLMPRNETLKQNLQAKCNKYPTTKTVVC
ncbi:hypothetical protein SARC_04712 [Sphaeroforma arctica JP610]|uniref:Uncharacterized protein n=1 Tax=Sphaeroforma arctica JP610 TaxID=667725 RepID=A0A0L0G463_9EUKA|nr:hypothetical protein SARC_04712 [Sphaeroforma arctica JP610]KNC83023.1 hypothetical protein SARC_04712 [Sphaeroforma arctica JP610]|eukprot:XP_014156925.1 hypothetical protein SARC_04712 [Sphaeroforma arctica JP610]